MAILGTGIGFTMPVMILSVQNTADSADLGVATSTITFFRSVGGSMGVAAFGAIFNTRLAAAIHDVLPADLAARFSGKAVTVEAVRALPLELQGPYGNAFADAMTGIFLLAVPMLVAGLIVAWMTKEVPLRTKTHVAEREEADVGQVYRVT
jgi:hypothetical protein